MKKIIAIAATGFIFTACFKRTCTCTDPVSGETHSKGSTKTTSPQGAKNFEKECESTVYKVTTNGVVDYTYACVSSKQ